MPYPSPPIVATGQPIDPEKLEDALEWLRNAVTGIELQSRSSTSPWTLDTNPLGHRIKYTGATDVVWTVPADLNPHATAAVPLRILQASTGKVTLDLSAWTTVNKPVALSPIQTGGPGRVLALLIGPTGSSEIDIDAT